MAQTQNIGQRKVHTLKCVIVKHTSAHTHKKRMEEGIEVEFLELWCYLKIPLHYVYHPCICVCLCLKIGATWNILRNENATDHFVQWTNCIYYPFEWILFWCANRQQYLTLEPQTRGNQLNSVHSTEVHKHLKWIWIMVRMLSESVNKFKKFDSTV